MPASLSASWPYILDLGAFTLCVALIVGYQIRLQRHIRRMPGLTVQGLNAQARAAWVERIMTGERDILAVQTFRNSTMAATLMASTAVILILAILNLMAGAGKLTNTLHLFNAWGPHTPGLWSFKLMLVLVDFFVAFFAFSLAVRGYHHAGYLINVPLKGSHGITPQRVITLLSRASRYYSVGMRTYYLSVPLILWLFGAVWMLLATVILLLILNHLDHLPE
jgi:uncharacterized membrane protein